MRNRDGWSRRRLLIGAALVLPVAVIGTRRVLRPRFAGETLTVEEAHAAAATGEVVLVDIRRPDEWAATGVGAGAYPIDMRSDDFEAELIRAVGGDMDRPVALICAAGVRSARLAARLEEAGFGRILDVPEGMQGSSAGPGWIASGLPVVPG